MENIVNYTVYLEEMRKSMTDKIDFLLDFDDSVDTIVDFGCADGLLLALLSEKLNNKQFVGFDMNKTMIDKAKHIFSNGLFIETASPFYEKSENAMLVLSSVLHEVYNYCSDDEISQFWRDILNSRYKFIAIRDMYYSSLSKTVRQEDIERVLLSDKITGAELVDYERYIGNIRTKKNFAQLLLKYRYKDNWVREVQEDYFSYDLDGILHCLKQCGYKVVFDDIYTLDFIKNQVKQDLDIDIDFTTHRKVVLQRIE